MKSKSEDSYIIEREYLGKISAEELIGRIIAQKNKIDGEINENKSHDFVEKK